MAAEAPEVFSGWRRSVTANGTEIGDWVTDWSPEFEDQLTDFQGSNGKPRARTQVGQNLDLTFTCGTHPTPMSILEPAYWNPEKPPVTFVVTEYDGRVYTIVATITHLTPQGGSGDVLTTDVETNVLSVSGFPGQG